MINFSELSGYFRDALALLAFLFGAAYGVVLLLFHRQKKAGWAVIMGFFFMIFDRLAWRLVNSFWLGDLYQIVADYERIYVMMEITGAATFLLGTVLLIFALYTLVRSNQQNTP